MKEKNWPDLLPKAYISSGSKLVQAVCSTSLAILAQPYIYTFSLVLPLPHCSVAWHDPSKMLDIPTVVAAGSDTESWISE
jgi:hypothetical protein